MTEEAVTEDTEKHGAHRGLLKFSPELQTLPLLVFSPTTSRGAQIVDISALAYFFDK
jgi:hypothetical protein